MKPTSNGSHRFFNALPAVLFLFIAAGVGTVAWTASRPPTFKQMPLPDYGAVADFSLRSSDGSAVTLGDLARFPWIADFIFTRCEGICPMMSSKMKELSADLKGSRFVSFSVDPARDTPEVLARYAAGLEADTRRWFFLTGENAELDRVTKSFHMNDTSDPAMHSARFVLVDGRGRIRGYYDSSDEAAMENLLRDTRILEKEGKSGL
jgi:protein SCO1/2